MTQFEITKIIAKWSRRPGKGVVDPSSNLLDLAQDWYSDNSVFALGAKSKAWSKVRRKVNSLINKEIKKRFDTDLAYYNQHAGCSCPCSPGWTVGDVEYEWNGKKQWTWNNWTVCTITFDEDVMEEFQDFLNVQRRLLDEEKKTDQGWADWLEHTQEKAAA